MRPLNVLIGCEASGIVRDAFIAHGHSAVSCDLRPTERPGPHYQGDVRDLLHPGLWDLAIFHPDCTYLTSAAEWLYKDSVSVNLKPGTLYGAARWAAREEAIEFVDTLWNAPIPFIAIENPVGVLGTRWRKADQWIQPYEFGHDASKRTGLWLKGLPPIVIDPARRFPGRIVEHNGKQVERWGNQTDSGQNRLSPAADRWSERSETYPGIAAAWADQWGRYVSAWLDEAEACIDILAGIHCGGPSQYRS